MTKKGLRVGLIGVGFHGPLFPTVLSHSGKGSRVTTVVDLNPEALDVFGDEFDLPGSHRFLSVGDFLKAKQEVDCVIVATPADDRSPVLDCLDAGLPVFCENPLALNRRVAQAIAARSKDVPCCVNEQWRYLTSVERARCSFERGDIGEVHSMTIEGKGRRGWTEFTRIGTHLLSVAIHTFGLQDIVSCSAVGMKGHSLDGRFDPQVITATWGTRGGGEPIIRANFDATGQDVRKCCLEVRGTKGRIKLIGGLLEGLYFSDKPCDLTDCVGDWERYPIDGTWDIDPGEEREALEDPDMNPTFWLWEGFEEVVLGERPKEHMTSPPADYISVTHACELLRLSLAKGGTQVGP